MFLHSFIHSFIHSFVQRHRYSWQYKTKNMNSPGSGNKLLRWPLRKKHTKNIKQ